MRGAAASLLIVCALAFLNSCARPGPPAPVHKMGLQTEASAGGGVIVRQNDTLWMVSKRYNLPLRDLIDANNLSAPYTIHTGQRLRLPVPRTYKVQPRDTLYRISRMFDVDTTEIARANALKAPYRLKAGQIIRVPFAGQDSASSATHSSAISAKTPAVKHKPIGKSKPTQPVAGNLLWPVKGQVISGYGPKEGGLHNDGINIAVAAGTPVLAAADGQVAYVGDKIRSYGNLVLIRHSSGTVTAYAHLESVQVARGDRVRRGQSIGAVGKTGAVQTPQLHFEIRHGNKAVNPAGKLSDR